MGGGQMIGEKVQAWMDEQKVTQADIAKRCGVQGSRIQEIRDGRNNWPNSRIVFTVAQMMGTTMDWLLDATQSYPPKREAKGFSITEQERKWVELGRMLEEIAPGEVMRRLTRINPA